MRLLKALEKHIPSAQLLLEEASREETVKDVSLLWSKIDVEKTEFVAAYGLSAPLYALARLWLDENCARRLVFVEEKGGALSRLLEDDDAILLLNDLRVKIYFLETPLQIEPVAKAIGWQAVFREMVVLQTKDSDYGAEFQKELERSHLAAHLLLSEGSDWSCSILKNGRANRRRASRSGLALRDAFAGIPAVIVGAGPSLEKNLHLLSELENRALIFAGGSALNVLNVEPHFAASIDKEAPYAQFKRHPFFETPFCYQNRMNQANFSLVHGEGLLFPDSGSPLMRWLDGIEEEFDGGWTVGNFLTAAALLFGCDPILFVGMDLCYQKSRKYAGLDASLPDGLVQTRDAQGKDVWTQRDWLMAAQWTKQLAAKHPETQFINATEGGLELGVASESLIQAMRLCPKQRDLRGQVHAAIQQLPFHVHREERWSALDLSLERCKHLCENVERLQIEDLETEAAYQKLLLPLWQVWKSVFEREIDVDRQPLEIAEKMRLNQILFFQQVLQEHIHGKE